jgi:hypothetical protein
MNGEWTVRDALAKREHFIALGQTDIWLHRDESDKPWDKVTHVEAGGSYRLNMPRDIKLSAEIDGLTFSWYADFENKDANGKSVSIFDRDRMREIYRSIPKDAQRQLCELLKHEVLPAMSKHTAEIRAALNNQGDSEYCVRGIIAWAEGDPQ